MLVPRCILSAVVLGTVTAAPTYSQRPAPESASQATQVLDPVRTTASLRNARADTLEQQATATLRGTEGWRRAARLQRRAAELRGDDPRAVESFARAAWLYSGAGRLGLAREMMERAGERAAMGGDVERAAGAYLDAALIAIEADREDLLPGLVQRSRRLIDSPVLPAERRAVLMQRIQGAPALAQHWRQASVN